MSAFGDPDQSRERKADTTTMQALRTAIVATIILCGPAAIPGLLALLITHNGYVGNDTFIGATIMDMIAVWWIIRRWTPANREEEA